MSFLQAMSKFVAMPNVEETSAKHRGLLDSPGVAKARESFAYATALSVCTRKPKGPDELRHQIVRTVPSKVVSLLSPKMALILSNMAKVPEEVHVSPLVC